MLMSRSDRVLNVMNVREPYTAQEIASALNVTRRTAHNYLEDLYEDGKVERKKHTNNRVTWWREE
jgi:predicted ArsR family transcriptional regulator